MPAENKGFMTGFRVFWLLVCLYMVTFGGHFYSGDGIEVARTAESLVMRGDLALARGEGERDWGYPGRDGKRYAPYAIGQSLAETPLIAAADLATAPIPLDQHLKDRVRHAAAVSSNVFITAATAWVLYLLGLRLGYGVRLATGLSLLYGLGTMAWVYARHDFSDPLTSLTLLSSVLLLRRYGDGGRRGDIMLAGLLLGLSLLTKYQMVIFCPVMLFYLILQRRQRGERGLPGMTRDAVLLAAPVILFGLIDLGINFAKFGSMISTGYEQEASPWAGLGHIPVGLYGFLLSPGKSVFLYNPVLLLLPFAARPFHRAHRNESLLIIAAAGVTLLCLSPLYWWHGDWAWGPRYLLPLVPLMVVALGPLMRSVWDARRGRSILTALIMAALLVNLLGITVNFFFYIRTLGAMEFVHDDWNFIPGLSPVAFHAHVVWSDLNELVTGTPVDYVYRAWKDGRFVDAVIPLSNYSREGKIPDFFFFKPYDTRLERWSLGGAGFLFVVLSVLAARSLRRGLPGGRAA